MKKQNLTEISRKSGRSVSTVSKVLRNCPGVDAETRAAVRSAAEGEGGEIRRGNAICVILPDNPKYFWHRAIDYLADERIDVTLKIYSSMSGDEDAAVSVCLREAEAEGAGVVILAACPKEEVKAELTQMAKRMLVLQICDHTPIPNTFFVGSDPLRDGKMLARGVADREGRLPVVGVIRQNGSESCEKRIQGFLEALGDRAEIRFIERPSFSSLYSSHLARAIDREGVALDYLFCYSGLTTQTCDALYKLRDHMRTEFIGFELPPTAEKHWQAGRIAALAIQKPEDQLAVALGLADRYLSLRLYPDRKVYDLPSEYRFYSIEG